MNDSIRGLHTVARKYCIDILNKFYEYMELPESTHENEINKSNGTYQNICAKFDLFKAILDDLEEFTPENFVSYEEARSMIIYAIREANSRDVERPYKEGYRIIFKEEREKFCIFINSLNHKDVINTSPLFYRRTLGKKEVQHIRKELKECWGVGSFWYPLAKIERSDALAFWDDCFKINVSIEGLKDIFKRHGITKITEYREFEYGYEMDISVFNPELIWCEGYWFSIGMDWLIYVSHENTITIGGEWLINEIKIMWSEWEKGIF